MADGVAIRRVHRGELMSYTLLAVALAMLPSRAPASPKESGEVPDAHLSAPLAVPQGREIRVAFLITPGAEVVDYAGPWGVFEYVKVGEDKHHPFKLYTVAASKEVVKTSFGMAIVPDHTFADAPAPDLVVVPAADLDELPAGAREWLRSVQKDSELTMSVCNGSFILGAAGLLDGKKATSHHRAYKMLHEMYPTVTVIPGVRYVEDGKLATAGGLTSGIDLALRVVERYFGRAVTKETATYLEYQGTGWMHPASNAELR